MKYIMLSFLILITGCSQLSGSIQNTNNCSHQTLNSPAQFNKNDDFFYEHSVKIYDFLNENQNIKTLYFYNIENLNNKNRTIDLLKRILYC